MHTRAMFVTIFRAGLVFSVLHRLKGQAVTIDEFNANPLNEYGDIAKYLTPDGGTLKLICKFTTYQKKVDAYIFYGDDKSNNHVLYNEANPNGYVTGEYWNRIVDKTFSPSTVARSILEVKLQLSRCIELSTGLPLPLKYTCQLNFDRVQTRSKTKTVEIQNASLTLVPYSDDQNEDNTGTDIYMPLYVKRMFKASLVGCIKAAVFTATANNGKVVSQRVRDFVEPKGCIHNSEAFIGVRFTSLGGARVTVAAECDALHKNKDIAILIKVAKECKATKCVHVSDCIPTRFDSVTCLCSPGYTGKFCDFPLACQNYVCYNKGKCELTVDNLPTCECAEGFYGVKCDISESASTCFDRPWCRKLMKVVLVLLFLPTGIMSFIYFMCKTTNGKAFSKVKGFMWLRKRFLDPAEVQRVAEQKVAIREPGHVVVARRKIDEARQHQEGFHAPRQRTFSFLPSTEKVKHYQKPMKRFN